jgi:hypothetical protein
MPSRRSGAGIAAKVENEMMITWLLEWRLMRRLNIERRRFRRRE